MFAVPRGHMKVTPPTCPLLGTLAPFEQLPIALSYYGVHVPC